MSDRVVLDSGYALEAILPTESKWQTEAIQLLERAAKGELQISIPLMFFAEVAAVVTRKVRGNKLDPTDAERFLEALTHIPVNLEIAVDHSLALYTKAQQWQAGAYDAIYLALAQGQGIPIATRDKGMIAAAKLAGVQVFKG